MNLYHISESARISRFVPRPSPSPLENLTEDVVFAISEKLLHNYLLPRDCPRVCFYANPQSSAGDREKFMGLGPAPFVVAVENNWLKTIERTTLYKYEMPTENFELIDECAQYYISRQSVEPLSIKPVYNILEEMLSRNIELRFMPSIQTLAQTVKSSSLSYSLIRMRNSIE